MLERSSPEKQLEAISVGRAVKRSMDAWLQGLGPLAPEMVQVAKPDGSQRSLGVGSGIHNGWRMPLWIGWYAGNDDLEEVFELATHASRKYMADLHLHGLTPGPLPLWAWEFTREVLSERIKTLIQRPYELLLTFPQARAEAAWATAERIAQRYQRTIPVDALVKGLERAHGGYGLDPKSVARVKRQADELIAAGATEFPAPWPLPDAGPSTGHPWDQFTEAQHLKRATVVYSEAIRLYEAVVDRYFARFRYRLRLAQNLPARVIGKVSKPARTPVPVGDDPAVIFHFEPLSAGEDTMIEFDRWQANEVVTFFDDAERNAPVLRRLRHRAEWLYPFAGSATLRIYDATPITRLAAEWLERDLRDCGWWPWP